MKRIDRTLLSIVERRSITFLRIALGTVFLWFGALKVAGVSPVADLVADTVSWVPGWIVVPAVGFLEIVIGVGLITGFAIRLVLLLFFLQMVGTFLAAVVQPSLMFIRGNPLLLSLHGEFLVKNLVLIAAGITIGLAIPGAKSTERFGDTIRARIRGKPQVDRS